MLLEKCNILHVLSYLIHAGCGVESAKYTVLTLDPCCCLRSFHVQKRSSNGWIQKRMNDALPLWLKIIDTDFNVPQHLLQSPVGLEFFSFLFLKLFSFKKQLKTSGCVAIAVMDLK